MTRSMLSVKASKKGRQRHDLRIETALLQSCQAKRTVGKTHYENNYRLCQAILWIETDMEV
jgi:hypothetical protein